MFIVIILAFTGMLLFFLTPWNSLIKFIIVVLNSVSRCSSKYFYSHTTSVGLVGFKGDMLCCPFTLFLLCIWHVVLHLL